MTKPHSDSSLARTVGNVSPQMASRNSSGVTKESTYYMDNYEATVTVHKSPPQQRKQYFDYLEIDDETREDSERVYPNFRLSKRKNLRVTFSDHIEVDVIENYESSGDEDEETNSVVDETLYEIPTDRNKTLRQISSSAEFKAVTENISPRPTKVRTVGDTKVSSTEAVTKTKYQTQTPAQNVHCSQPLLQKRRTTSRLSLTDLEKKTKEYISQLQEKTKRAETQARVAKAIFPDISAKIRSQPNYKQFIANARRAVEITRKYERPWVSGTSRQQDFNTWKSRSDTVRRTTSLPKNFKLPENLTSERQRPLSENVLVAGGERQRIRNS